MSLERFEELLRSGRHIFLTGAGGTGKSYLLDVAIKKYPDTFVITSTTGISAVGLNPEAKTIHSFSMIGTATNEGFPTPKCLEFFDYGKMSDLEAIKGAKRLIIEEVSMLSASRLDLVDRVFRRVRKAYKTPFGGIQMIFAGDFLQLPPVTKGDDEKAEYCFNARSWKEAKPEVIYLNEVKRTTNKEFAEMLLRIRTVNHTAADFKLLKSLEDNVLKNRPLILFASNKKADAENVKQLDITEGKLETHKGKFRGNKNPESAKEEFREIRENLLCPHILQLKEGCRVMVTENERKYPGDETPMAYVNGSLGTYRGFETKFTNRTFKQYEMDEETGKPLLSPTGRPYIIEDKIAYDVIFVELDSGKWVELKRMTWTAGNRVFNPYLNKEEWEVEYKQFPVKLAYALTMHKAQGLSIDSLEVDCEGIFTDSQFYVAVSRARSLEGLRVRNLKGKHVRASIDALEFYKELELEMKK